LEGGRDGFVKPVGSSSWNATEANALEELFLVSSVHDTVGGLMNQAITRDGKNTIILAKRDILVDNFVRMVSILSLLHGYVEMAQV